MTVADGDRPGAGDEASLAHAVQQAEQGIVSAVMERNDEQLQDAMDILEGELVQAMAAQEAVRRQLLLMAQRIYTALRQVGLLPGESGGDFQTLYDRMNRLPHLSALLSQLQGTMLAQIRFLREESGEDTSAVVRRAAAYIDDTFAQDISLEDIARKVGLSAAYLSHLFTRQIGQSPVAYIRQRRMEQAQALLLKTEWKVYEIATAVGYDQPRYFSTLFKQHTGMKPNEYRNRYSAAAPQENGDTPV